MTIEKHNGGTVTVRFGAGGLDEMRWHLVTSAETVTEEKPARLSRRLFQMCVALSGHPRSA